MIRFPPFFLTVMSIFDPFAQFLGFPTIFVPFFLQTLIHGLGIRKERIHVFQFP